jgi:hypothetical protein
LGFFQPSCIFLFLCLLFHLIIFCFHYFLLQFCFSLWNIYVIQQWIARFDFDCHHRWFPSLALYIFQYLIVSGYFFFVLGENSSYTINSCISYKFLEFRIC